MQSELQVLRALWERARTDGARARLLASFTEADRRQLYRLTGGAALVDGLEENFAGSFDYTLEPESQVCGGLELIWPGPLETTSFEQRVEKARLNATERELAERYGLTFAILKKQERRQLVGMLAN